MSFIYYLYIKSLWVFCFIFFLYIIFFFFFFFQAEDGIRDLTVTGVQTCALPICRAVVALLLNMILMMAGLILFGATLTLPGIAGIILTIGMAVDSNVLIFERIREELHSGKTVLSSVDQGFRRAFVTIIDTHVTTIVSS